MRHRKAIIAVVQDRYKKATKKQKSKILDEFCATTGYNRVYLSKDIKAYPWKGSRI